MINPELDRLSRLLEQTEGFALGLLQINAPVERRQVVSLLAPHLEKRGRKLRVLDLGAAIVDPWSEIQRLEPPPTASEALFVLGLEHSISAEAELPQVLVELNRSRERFGELPCPLVLVLPEFAVEQLARKAPDFWARRADVFDLDAAKEWGIERRRRLSGTQPMADDDLPAPRFETEASGRESELRMLEERLGKLLPEEEPGRQLELSQKAADLALSLGNGSAAARLAERALALARELGEPIATARALNRRNAIEAATGNLETALEAAQEAVAIGRAEAPQRPEARPVLADSLTQLGHAAGALGRSREALEAATEAVEILRSLAAERADIYLPDLAMGLNNLALRQHDLERLDDALEAARESMEIRRRLARLGPAMYLSDLARSLNNLGLWLWELGQPDEALSASQEAVDLRRRLAGMRPGEFVRDLAMSLNNLGIGLQSVGRHEEARMALQEAVDLYRRLYERPHFRSTDLAAGLGNLAKVLRDLGEGDAAVEAVREAEQVRAAATPP